MRGLGILLPLVGILLSACEPSEKVGRCNDQDLATALVYDSSGFPAYAGQALVEQSCANGSFCHTSGIPAANRIGAPHGLDFDMVGSRSEDEVDAEAVERLRRGRQVTFEWRDEIYGSVKSGFMPPAEAGQDVISDFGYRFADDRSPLPPIDSEEGMEILEQWLACGPPVVGSIIDFPTDMEPVGDVVERGSAQVPEPTWTSIYELVIEPQCVGCHGPGPASQIDASQLDLSDKDMAHAELVGVAAAGSACDGMGMLVVPNDPDASLLLDKMTAEPSCGDPMPLLPLPEDVRAPIRAWIEMGAAND